MVKLFRAKARAFQLLGVLYSSLAAASISESMMNRDVAIIGGGSSGTYAAIRLRDQGKSVVVVEKEPVLGGHTNTYIDPVTKQPINYGVEIFHNQNTTKNYFDRLNISYSIGPPPDSGASVKPVYLDAQTGTPVKYIPSNASPGLQAYAEQLAKYSALEKGFFLSDPVPEDLLMPFGEFMAKYPAITSAAHTIFNFAQGLGDFLNQPTLYVFKNFGLGVLHDAQNGFVVLDSGDNHEIYDKAAKLLGSDALLNSMVISTPQRTSCGVTMQVWTPAGRQTISAKKLLIAIPQKLASLIPFSPDAKESIIFAEFMNTGYYTSLVRNTCLPANFSSSSASANDSRYHVPSMPGVYSVAPTVVDGIFDIKYGSPHGFVPDAYVRSQILEYVRQLQENGLARKNCGDPEFVAYRSHTPFELTVSPGQIAAGFYRDLYQLQGYRGTWYTGAAFHTQDSSALWEFTEDIVLPSLLE